MTTTTRPSHPRIISMDQFRGFTVLGMFSVHFAGMFSEFFDLANVFKHNGTFLSFADTVLPSFLFAAGFALRLTFLKRLTTLGPVAAYGRAIRRCVLLVLLMQLLILSRWGPEFLRMTRSNGVLGSVNVLLKGRMLEALSIIGLASLWVLPVIKARASIRIAFLLAGLVIHALICHLFYFDFLYGRPNWLDACLGTAPALGAEGGLLGVLTWAVPILIGSLAYDLVIATPPSRASGLLLGWCAGLLVTGYGVSCISSLYPLAEPHTIKEYELVENGQIADSPVLPTIKSLAGTRSFWAAPPLVPPAAESQRQLNYWIMGKRVVTPSFILTATGFAVGIYALFIFMGDAKSMCIGLLRTFGQNPLAAYVIELYLLGGYVFPYLWPSDTTFLWALAHCMVWFALTYVAVRFLEWRRLYWRL